MNPVKMLFSPFATIRIQREKIHDLMAQLETSQSMINNLLGVELAQKREVGRLSERIYNLQKAEQKHLEWLQAREPIYFARAYQPGRDVEQFDVRLAVSKKVMYVMGDNIVEQLAWRLGNVIGREISRRRQQYEQSLETPISQQEDQTAG